MQILESFSSFSVDDVAKAKEFYGTTLGLQVEDSPEGRVQLQLPGGGSAFAYPKGEQHQPATFTVLNFTVEDISAAVDELTGKGVQFEVYPAEEFGMEADEKGIYWGKGKGNGPNIAWFKDPAGNVISVIES